MADNKREVSLIKGPLPKFLISIIAGFCAIFFPKLSTALSNFEYVDAELLDTTYLIYTIVFSMLIGVVVVIFDWGKAKEPGAIFMLALGMPALLAGALNTNKGLAELERSNVALEKLRQEDSALNDLDEFVFDEIYEVEDGKPTPVSKSEGPLINIFAPAYAYAAEREKYTPKRQTDSGSGRALNSSLEPRYLIVLKIESSKEDAINSANALENRDLNPKVVGAGDRFLVIEDLPPMTYTEAKKEVLRLQEFDELTPGYIDLGRKKKR